MGCHNLDDNLLCILHCITFATPLFLVQHAQYTNRSLQFDSDWVYLLPKPDLTMEGERFESRSSFWGARTQNSVSIYSRHVLLAGFLCPFHLVYHEFLRWILWSGPGLRIDLQKKNVSSDCSGETVKLRDKENFLAIIVKVIWGHDSRAWYNMLYLHD